MHVERNTVDDYLIARDKISNILLDVESESEKEKKRRKRMKQCKYK